MMFINNLVNKYKWAGGLALLVLALAACQSATMTPIEVPTKATEEPVEATQAPAVAVEEPAVMPSVIVADQSIEAGTVSIDEVISDGAGWLVIHAQADGKPGPILGYSQVSDGVTKNLMVEIDADKATETLYAMLHTDAGEAGKWEFPDGPDTPVKVDEKVVTPPPFHHVVAARIGCRREQVTREFSALEREGLIEKTKGALVLTKPLVLEQRLADALREDR